MICKKAIKIAMGVGMVLCATASFAVREQNFESGSLGSTDGWYGDVSSFEDITPQAPTVGYPLPSSNHEKTLLVEGSVICSNETTSATSSVSDFLIFIPEPSDELGTDELEGAKVAIAAGTNIVAATGKVPLCLYCKAGSVATPDWYEITTAATGTWLRVTLVFKDGRCRVSLDGEPVVNASGYAASSGDTLGGAWYNLANVPEGTDRSIASLSFIGCAKLDDVVIKDAFEEIIFPANVSPTMANMPGETVNYNDLNKWGVTSAYLNENYNQVYPNGNTSGMTIAQKLECGLDPTTDTKFEPVSITKTSAAEATITFPCDDSTKTGRYKIVITGGTCNNATVVTGATTEDCEDGRAKITLTGLNQTAPVMTFKLVAEK